MNTQYLHHRTHMEIYQFVNTGCNLPVEVHGTLLCQAATHTSHYFWHSGQGTDQRIAGLREGLDSCTCVDEPLCCKGSWLGTARIQSLYSEGMMSLEQIHSLMHGYQLSAVRKLKAQKTLVLTLDKRATTRLFKKLHKAAKTSLVKHFSLLQFSTQ